MKKRNLLPVVISIIVLASACRSEFEKIRSSADNELIFKRAFEYNEKKEYQRAQTLFELLIPVYRGKPELEKVYFDYAYTYYHLGQYIMAAYYFNNFTSTFSASPLKEEASFMAAYSNYKMSPTFRLDQTYSNKAIEEFQTFVNVYPNSERVKECNRLIDEMRLKLEIKAFDEGTLYYNLNRYQAATVTFENLLKDFPETANAEQVRFLIAKASYEFAQNSVYEKQEERFLKAVSYARDYMNKFSGNKNFKEIQLIFDNSVKKLKSLTNGRYQSESTGTGS
jgi:outer membrane protein assembly factor BamD